MRVDEHLLAGLRVLHHHHAQIGQDLLERIAEPHRDHFVPARKQPDGALPARLADEVGNQEYHRAALDRVLGARDELAEISVVGAAGVRLILAGAQHAVEHVQHMQASAARRDRGAKKGAKKEHKPVPPGSYTSGAVILISDGRRTTGPDPVEIAKIAADYGVRVFTVGFGTLDGSMVGSEEFSFWARLDEPTLKAVAAMTGAEYFHAGTGADLRKVYESLSLKFALERRETEITALLSAAAALLAVSAVLLSLVWFRPRV